MLCLSISVSLYLADRYDDVEQFTEEEAVGVLVELVVNMFAKLN
jgi:hypothetical protein